MNVLSNSVQLIGNLGKDVEFHQLKNGGALAKVPIATKEIFRDAKGNKKSETTWHQLIAWGKVAENMQVFLRRGSFVIIQGKLTHQTWGEGEKKQSETHVLVNQFRLIGQSNNARKEGASSTIIREGAAIPNMTTGSAA